jgi:protein SCO1/2
MAAPGVPGNASAHPRTTRREALGALATFGAVVAVLGSVVLATAGLIAWSTPPPTPAPSAAATSAARVGYLLATPRAAPAIDLKDAAGTPVSLTAMRGAPVLVFFGYTHCPDICPATIGVLGEVLHGTSTGARALFVTIDPERDTPAWLADYDRFLPAGLTIVRGTDEQTRATADAWNVKYARVDGSSPADYSMSHTADVFLLDADGTLRADFPFGTDAASMIEDVRAVASAPIPLPSTAPSAAVPPTPAPSSLAASSGGLHLSVVSTSIWADPSSLVILHVADAAGNAPNPTATVTVQAVAPSGSPTGPLAPATRVQPPGVAQISYVASVPIPTAGTWQLSVTTTLHDHPATGTATVTALDPGATPRLGTAAPTARTPTLDDAGGVAQAVTTDPAPDLRLSQHSTADLLAAHTPFVLVVDSVKFRTSPACGRAVVLARYMQDRWPDVPFVHLEPFRYSVVEDTPVLQGTLDSPTLTDPAAAWGFGGSPWGARSMPWVFVVDANGNVRAKYQGVVGSDDVDVVLAWLTSMS